MPKSDFHHQQRKRQQKRYCIWQHDGQRVNQITVADPEKQADIEADQHQQRDVAYGFSSERVQGLREIGQRAQRPSREASQRSDAHTPA